MTITFWGITWSITYYAWMSLLALGIIGLIIYRHQHIENLIYSLVGNRATILLQHTSFTRRIIKSVLLGIGVLFLGITLWQPHWDKDIQEAEEYSRDLYIVLDISRSMLAQDVQPNRLELAKILIKKLVSKLSCQRVGLIVFSGSAFVQCPLTQDHGAFNVFLDHVDVETIASGTTSLEGALNQVINTYNRMPTKKHKLVVLVTDGEDFSDNMTAMQERIAESGLTICAIGIGTPEGAPVPLYDEYGNHIGHLKDTHDNVVISCHNAALLQDLVCKTGGQYCGALHDQSGIDTMVNYIMHIEKELLESNKTWIELKAQYPYFVMVSFICFLIEWLL
ncbi:MAG TPA: VWA domain-containing protein [Candidatus Babeliales bacterium]|jgi:Ca-activated chloride channel family protein|nr:VWA domain-containing protein [Candidatus Babeliales bacterium]